VEVLCHLAEIGQGSAVHTLLEYPIKYCPEILLIVVAQVKTAINQLQHEIFAALFPSYLDTNPNCSILLHQLWRDIVLWGMMDIHAKDPSSISKILDARQEIKALTMVLDVTPFSFAIELAALASKREFLNLKNS
jgi:CCR4-NOT transcription complex subunit 1